MSPDLSQQVRGVLQRVQTQLTQQPTVQRPAQQSSMQQLRAWCEQHAVQTQPWFAATTVTFDRNLLARIEQTLTELGLHALTEDLRQHDRFAQSDHSLVEHKSLGLIPTERRVLMAQANCGAYFPEWVTAAPSQWVMDIDWQSLQLEVFPSLVVVENRDSFYQYFSHHPQRYQLPQLALDALVIYRGDGLESRACKALMAAFAQTGKPMIFFGDYDTAGLSIALHEPYHALLLPSFEAILSAANDHAQPPDQLHLGDSITAYAEQWAEHEPLKPYVQHNIQQQKGLRQQAFKGPLQLVPVCL